MILGTSRGLLLGAKVELVMPDRVTAAWAHRSIVPNDKFLYVTAKYVEADKPNENRNFWSFEDLVKSQATIKNSPINVMHQPHNIVGVMVDQEMMYPETADLPGDVAAAKDYSAEKRKELAEKGQALPDGSFPIADKGDLSNAIQAYGRASNKEAAKRHIIKRAKQLGATDMLPDDWKVSSALDDPDEIERALDYDLATVEQSALAYDYAQPHIEVLGALWRFYFPMTMEKIEAAQEMGSLFISMECISKTVTRVDLDGSETEYPFRGGSVKDYDFHAESNYVRLNDPHFIGAGLVIPPGRPGWKGAEVRELAAAMGEDEERLYEQLKAETPNLDARQWEDLMAAFLLHAGAARS